jgi:hypothetical protein
MKPVQEDEPMPYPGYIPDNCLPMTPADPAKLVAAPEKRFGTSTPIQA